MVGMFRDNMVPNRPSLQRFHDCGIYCQRTHIIFSDRAYSQQSCTSHRAAAQLAESRLLFALTSSVFNILKTSKFGSWRYGPQHDAHGGCRSMFCL